MERTDNDDQSPAFRMDVQNAIDAGQKTIAIIGPADADMEEEFVAPYRKF